MATRQCLTRISNGYTALLQNPCLSHLPQSNVRYQVTDQTFKLVSVERDAEINNLAIVTMKRKPVNSLNHEHLNELISIFNGLNDDGSYNAMILNSGFPGVFCAGVDITCVYQRTREEIFHYWRLLQDMWLALYGNRLITAAVLNGHSPAAGCVMGMACDLRYMADGKYQIGMNETLLGLTVPFFLRHNMQNLIGYKEMERAIMLGSLFSPNEALKIGLVDQVLPMDDLMNAAKNDIKKWLKIPESARVATKHMMRKDILTKLKSELDEDANRVAEAFSLDETQESLANYVSQLAERKKKK